MKEHLPHSGNLARCLLLLTLLGAKSLSVAEVAKSSSAPSPSQVHKVKVTSPVQYFRELLAMSPEAREKALSSESPEKRTILLSKIAEYEAMTPQERELRLRMTQLRWHLVPLLKSSPSERQRLLANISPEDRPLIERRLAMWDQIPIQVQKEFLENEIHLDYILKWRGSSQQQRANLLESFPPEKRQKLESELSKWNSLSEERRQEMANRFNQFFELDDREKDKVLGAIPESSRAQMERMLRSLEHVPADQRKQYVEAYDRFARMNTDERRQFLKNAERWEGMSETERQAWRELVKRTPPLPPMPSGPPNRPPLPPPALVKTNTQK